ncbi:MAG: hypothetical protein RR472_02250, partial [Anaerovoracaceae bacterium]
GYGTLVIQKGNVTIRNGKIIADFENGVAIQQFGGILNLEELYVFATTGASAGTMEVYGGTLNVLSGDYVASRLAILTVEGTNGSVVIKSGHFESNDKLGIGTCMQHQSNGTFKLAPGSKALVVEDNSSPDITADFTDAKFKEYIYQKIGKTAPAPIYANDVATISELDINSWGVQSLDGIQHFKSLQALYCKDNKLTTIPALPDSLLLLDCTGNNLVSLPKLPDSLLGLVCTDNALKELPALPSSLSLLECGDNDLAALPALPTALEELECQNNRLAEMDVTGIHLVKLDCSGNRMTDKTKVKGFTSTWNNTNFKFGTQNITFIPVRHIYDLPSLGVANTPLTLTGTVLSSDATNRTITWSYQDNTPIIGNTITSTVQGTVLLTAIIKDGLGAGLDYRQNFSVLFGPATGHTHTTTEVVAKAATCTATGNLQYWICQCGAAFYNPEGGMEIPIEDTVLAIVPHSFDGEWQKDDTSHWRTCTICNTEKSESKAHFWILNNDKSSETKNIYDCSICAAEKAVPLYTLTINDGTGNGRFEEGTVVSISANPAQEGKKFKNWTTSGGGRFADANSDNTTYTMPGNDTTVTANYARIGSSGGEATEILYNIIKNANGTYPPGSNKGYTFTCDGQYADYIETLCDGNKIPEKYLTVVSGSTIITIKPEYLKTLSEGKHTLKVVYKNGYASTNLTIGEHRTAPQTGDPAHMASWLALLFVSGGAFTGLAMRKWKKVSKK